MDSVLVGLVASLQVALANSNQGLLQTLEDNHLDLEHKQVDSEEDQVDLEGEQVVSELNKILQVLVNRQIQVVLGEASALKFNLNRHQHSVILEALDRILNNNNLVYLEVVLEGEQVALDNKVDLLSNRIHLDSAMHLVRNPLKLN